MCAKKSQPTSIQLTPEQARYFKNLIREARYAAQADAENFSKICFALEDLGAFLTGAKIKTNQKGEEKFRHNGDPMLHTGLKDYEKEIRSIAENSSYFKKIENKPENIENTDNTENTFSPKNFEITYEIARNGRNENMHTGAHARNVTQHAIELCIGLEEALATMTEKKAKDFMVSNPIFVEEWHPVGHVRKLMLMHSFSYIPVRIGDKWNLISDTDIAKFLGNNEKREYKLRLPIETAKSYGESPDENLITIEEIITVGPEKQIENISTEISDKTPSTCLVIENKNLVGVLTPSDFM